MKENKQFEQLETEKLGHLIAKFALPAIVASLVGSLYNIVDQIFIGQSVGTIGNVVTNIAFLLTMLMCTLAMVFGGGDMRFCTNMQKDWVVQTVSSVEFNPQKGNDTILYDAEGNALATIEGGYLDIGIIDTMKDLHVNFAGAVVFSICGYLYVYRRDTYKFAGNFIIRKESCVENPHR